jgi:hypothetical protein
MMDAEALVDALIRIEETYCEQGRELREQKFSLAVPDIDDLTELGRELGRSRGALNDLFGLGPVEQAELIIARHEYDQLEAEYQGHLRGCEQCRSAVDAQEKLLLP